MKTNKRSVGAAVLAAALIMAPCTFAAEPAASPPAKVPAAAKEAAKPAPLSAEDQKFVDQAWNINTTEIKLGREAEKKANNADVKAYAKSAVADHNKLNDELTSLATEHGASVPKAVSSENQQLIDRLSKLNGSDFDKQYMSAMIDGHEKAIATFHDQAREKADTAVDKWAARTVPMLQQHLQMAEKTGKEVGAQSNTAAAVTASHEEHPTKK